MSQNLQPRPYTTWQLLTSYWQSNQRMSAYALLVVVLVMTISLVMLEVVLNYWYNYFYDALQEYAKSSVYNLIWVFIFIVAIIIVVSVYRYYLQAFLGLRWRQWLTDQFLNRWLEKRSYYYLENFDETTDNPDQRIQEDIGALVNGSLSLLVGLVSSVISFFAFIFILWRLSGTLTIPLGSEGSLVIPGYLAWVGICYAIIGSYLTHRIGRPLVALNFEQQRREANFRFAAVDLRTHAEHVALYRGEHHQKNILGKLVDRFLENWYMIILRQKLLLWFTAGYNQISVLLPLVVALPNYFNKVFKLGGLIQTLQAFRQVQDALSFFVNAYTSIAEWRAVTQRLLTFLNHVDAVQQKVKLENHFVFRTIPENKIIAKNITILTPHHDKLLENINEEFIHGKHYLIKGVSGMGKSTFVRVLAGIWPYGSGEVSLPANQKMMYLSQDSYMPLGDLEEELMFPDDIHSVPEAVLIDLLNKCGLPELTTRLHDIAMWSQQLSPGEQQRIAFVRVILQKPDWVFLDESTSSLDLASEKYLYRLLKTELPNCSLISVGHRPSLTDYHDHEVEMQKYFVLSAKS